MHLHEGLNYTFSTSQIIPLGLRGPAEEHTAMLGFVPFELFLYAIWKSRSTTCIRLHSEVKMIRG